MRVLRIFSLNLIVSMLLLMVTVVVGTPLALLHTEWMPKTVLWGFERAGFIAYEEPQGQLSSGWSVKSITLLPEKSLMTKMFKVITSDKTLSEPVTVNNLKLHLTLTPNLEEAVTVNELSMELLRLQLPKKADEPEEKEHPLQQLQNLALPEIELPFQVSIEQVSIGTLEIAQKPLTPAVSVPEPLFLTDLELQQLKLFGHSWTLPHVALTSEWGSLELHGFGEFLGHWPHEITVTSSVKMSEFESIIQPPLELLGMRLLNTEAQVALRGNINQLRITGSVQAEMVESGEDQTSLNLQVEVEANREGLVVNQLVLKGPLGQGQVEGGVLWTLNQQQAIDLTGYGKVDLQQFALNRLIPEKVISQLQPFAESPVGRLDAALSFRFGLQGDQWQLASDVTSVSTHFLGEPLALSAQLRSNNQKQLTLFAKPMPYVEVDSIKGRWGQGVAWKGRVIDGWDLTTAIDSTRFPQGVRQWIEGQGIKGDLKADLSVKGSQSDPTWRLESKVNGLAIQDQLLWQQVGLKVNGPLDDLDIQLALEEGPIDTTTRFVLNAKNMLTRDPKHQSLTGRMTAWRIQNPFAAQVVLSAPNMRAAVESERSQFPTAPWLLQDGFDWRWSPASQQLSVEPFCLQSDKATLCKKASEITPSAGALALTFDQWKLDWIQSMLPETVDMVGGLAGEVDVAWPLSVSAKVQSQSIRMHYQEIDGQEIDGQKVDGSDKQGERDKGEKGYKEKSYKERSKKIAAQEVLLSDVSMGFDLIDQQIALTLTGKSSLEKGSKKQSLVDLTLNIDPQKKVIHEGLLKLKKVDLDIAKPWLQKGQSLSGIVDIDMSIQGPLRKPKVTSTLNLQAVNFMMQKPAIQLEGFNLKGGIANEQLTLTGRGRLNSGDVDVVVKTHWRDPKNIVADLKVKGGPIPFQIEKVGEITFSPDIRAVVDKRRLTLTGKVVIPEADIDIKNKGPKRVALSRDVVIVDKKSEQAKAVERLIETFIADLEITLGKRVKFKAYGAAGLLKGDLAIQYNEKGILSGNGVVSVDKGIYKAYGQELDIAKGQVLFSGPIHLPRVDIAAVRDSAFYNVRAGLKLQGFARSPVASLYAEPLDPLGDISQQPVSDREILSYLVLGRPSVSAESGETADESQVLTQAALSLGLAKTGLAKKASKALGVKNLELATEGSGDDAQLVVGGDLSDRLHLQYSVGLFAPANSIILRYQINRRLYLEALSGLERALDLFYSFDF